MSVQFRIYSLRIKVVFWSFEGFAPPPQKKRPFGWGGRNPQKNRASPLKMGIYKVELKKRVSHLDIKGWRERGSQITCLTSKKHIPLKYFFKMSSSIGTFFEKITKGSKPFRKIISDDRRSKIFSNDHLLLHRIEKANTFLQNNLDPNNFKTNSFYYTILGHKILFHIPRKFSLSLHITGCFSMINFQSLRKILVKSVFCVCVIMS